MRTHRYKHINTTTITHSSHAHRLYHIMLQCTKMYSLLFIAHNSVVVGRCNAFYSARQRTQKNWIRDLENVLWGRLPWALSIYKCIRSKHTKPIQVTIQSDGFMYIISNSNTIEKACSDKKCPKWTRFTSAMQLKKLCWAKKRTQPDMCMCISASHIRERICKTTRKNRVERAVAYVQFFAHRSLDHSFGTRKKNAITNTNACGISVFMLTIDAFHVQTFLLTMRPIPLTISIHAYHGGTQSLHL